MEFCRGLSDADESQLDAMAELCGGPRSEHQRQQPGHLTVFRHEGTDQASWRGPGQQPPTSAGNPHTV